MKIKVYQMNVERDKRRLLFMDYDYTRRYGGVEPEEYDLVFDGEVTAKTLDEIFTLFNVEEPPKDYHGRNMSVSDVIVCPGGAFFVDDVGFAKLENFNV